MEDRIYELIALHNDEMVYDYISTFNEEQFSHYAMLLDRIIDKLYHNYLQTSTGKDDIKFAISMMILSPADVYASILFKEEFDFSHIDIEDGGPFALSLAAKAGNNAVVKYLIDKGVDVDEALALHNTLKYKHLHTLQLLIDMKANPNEILLAYIESERTIKLLLEMKAIPDAKVIVKAVQLMINGKLSRDLFKYFERIIKFTDDKASITNNLLLEAAKIDDGHLVPILCKCGMNITDDAILAATSTYNTSAIKSMMSFGFDIKHLLNDMLKITPNIRDGKYITFIKFVIISARSVCGVSDEVLGVLCAECDYGFLLSLDDDILHMVLKDKYNEFVIWRDNVCDMLNSNLGKNLCKIVCTYL